MTSRTVRHLFLLCGIRYTNCVVADDIPGVADFASDLDEDDEDEDDEDEDDEEDGGAEDVGGSGQAKGQVGLCDCRVDGVCRDGGGQRARAHGVCGQARQLGGHVGDGRHAHGLARGNGRHHRQEGDGVGRRDGDVGASLLVEVASSCCKADLHHDGRARCVV